MTEDTETAERDEPYEPKTGESRVWLDMIAEAEKTFRFYNDKADAIDRLYADLNRLASIVRDKEFQLFWANMEVMKPSIYARKPIPVVVPRFKDRRPLFRVASEFLERSVTVSFDNGNVNSTMLHVRDDLAVVSRGVPWVRYVSKQDSDSPTEKVCYDWVFRRDFLHEPARIWEEVGWVARRCWMTLDEMEARFKPYSGDAYLQAATHVLRKDIRLGATTRQEKAPVWEIWSKTENKSVWVCEGVDVTLDEGEPHLHLEGFYPCPRPAYATIQRGSLMPVPEMLLYRDQLEEINQLTNRIHALADAIRVRGFFPAGGEVGEAIEAALKMNDDRQIMVPIANWAAFGGTGEQIIWLPIDIIAKTMQGIVELRRALISDVFEIMGLSDIMRGNTDAQETLGAQQLKAQFGSVRIRDKQAELARVAADMVRIAAEIMAEHFDPETLFSMAQMDIPRDKDIRKQIAALEKQAGDIQAAMERAQADPQIMQQAQANPEEANKQIAQAQEMLQGIQGQIKQLSEQVTLEQVMKLLRDEKLRPFALEIETDSTIAPDEQAEKQARTEFVTALAGLIAQFGPIIIQKPELSPMVGQIIKFALAPYRVGRELEGTIDEAMQSLGQQSQQQPNPEAEKAKADQAAAQMQAQLEMQKLQAESQLRAQELQMQGEIELRKTEASNQAMIIEAQLKQQDAETKLRQSEVQAARDQQKHDMEMRRMAVEIARMEREAEIGMANAAIDQQARIDAATAQKEQANATI